jgi:hypothetical protein
MMPSHTFSSNLAFLIGLFSKCCRKLTSKKTANSSGNSKLIRKQQTHQEKQQQACSFLGSCSNIFPFVTIII